MESISEAILANVRKLLGSRVRNLDVVLREGRIVLLGKAPDYYAKQLSQQLVMKLFAVTTLDNEIQVEPRSSEAD